jgi:hypothetical protein
LNTFAKRESHRDATTDRNALRGKRHAREGHRRPLAEPEQAQGVRVGPLHGAPQRVRDQMPPLRRRIREPGLGRAREKIGMNLAHTLSHHRRQIVRTDSVRKICTDGGCSIAPHY